MITNAATVRIPAVQASLKPFRYFWVVGRSCSTPYSRLAPRSIWPMARVAEASAATAPARRAKIPPALALLAPWRMAWVKTWLAGPGASRSTLRVTRSRTWSTWRAVASPTTAMTNGSRVSITWKARAREWLKPSAARKRRKASLSSWAQPVLRRVCSASSPSSS
jgi:hypothetical protein